MPLYKYKASDTSGKSVELVIEGENQKDSLSRLRRRGMTPIKCYGEVDSMGGGGLFSRSNFNVYEFTSRLVPLLNSHIQLERALGIITESMEDGEPKDVVNSIRRGLHEGKKFSSLIRDNGSRFPRLYANLVETGEKTGCLPEVMTELQRFLTSSKETKEFIISSSIYPIIVLAITFGVVLLVFTVFIPHFAKIFIDMGKTLPLPTQILMTISNVFIWLWWFWLILIGALIWFINEIKKGGGAKRWFDRFILKVPIFKRLIVDIEMNRFIRTLAILITNHVHLLDTIKIAVRVISNSTIAESFNGTSAELRSGTKLSSALKKSSFIPRVAVQMLVVGEESGSMGEMLGKVADEQEGLLKTRIRRLLSLFEPAVILFLAVVIFIVVISIFLAIMEMNEIQ